MLGRGRLLFGRSSKRLCNRIGLSNCMRWSGISSLLIIFITLWSQDGLTLLLIFLRIKSKTAK